MNSQGACGIGPGWFASPRTTTPPRRLVAALATSALGLGLSVLGGCSGADPRLAQEGRFEEWSWDMWGDQDQAQADGMRAEELTSECLADFGFEYFPGESTVWDDGPELDLDWGGREFVEQYGYGATTGAYGPLDETWDQPEETNANNEYLETLSESEYQAYMAAMYQTAIEGTEGGTYGLGCYGWGYSQVFTAPGGPDDPRFTGLQAEIQRMHDSVPEDSRIVELDAAWAACMREAGYPDFSGPQDAVNSIYDEMNARSIQAFAGVTEDSDQATREGAQERALELWAALRPLELELSLVDFECRESLDYERVHQDTLREIEDAFYDAHRDELEAWRDAVVQARGER